MFQLIFDDFISWQRQTQAAIVDEMRAGILISLFLGAALSLENTEPYEPVEMSKYRTEDVGAISEVMLER